jgi:hypothetical protein
MSESPILTDAAEALAQAEARYPAVALTLRHWDSLRAGRAMPTRGEIDPRALSRALEFLFIAEPVAPGVARMRLAGQHLSLLLGMEPRGMPLCALFTASARDELAAAIEQITRNAIRVLLPVRSESGLGRPALEGLLALMPLGQPTTGQPVRILGVLQTRGAIGRAPRKLGLSGPVERLGASPSGSRHDTRAMLRVIDGGRA